MRQGAPVTSPLTGFTIGITGDRRAGEQAELLQRRGATVIHGPMIETLALADSPELRLACESLLANPPDVMIATTGVGIRSWMEAADGLGLGNSLRRVLGHVEVLARSPKAAGALLTAGLPLHWQAKGEQAQNVIDYLAERNLAGLRIAVQRDGADEPVMAETLAKRGAEVVDIPIYRWVFPRDTGPAHRLLDSLVDRQLDAITVTSSPALANLFALAADRPDVKAVHATLATEVLVACVGPVCTASARKAGITRIVQPDRYRIGSMVKELADELAAAAWHLEVDAVSLTVQGGQIMVDAPSNGPIAHQARLPRREQQLLARLAAAAGRVVSKSELGRDVWGPDIDLHVVEVTVGRLRANLGAASGAIVTVPRRGYRLAAAPTGR